MRSLDKLGMTGGAPGAGSRGDIRILPQFYILHFTFYIRKALRINCGGRAETKGMKPRTRQNDGLRGRDERESLVPRLSPRAAADGGCDG